jgi:predicted amidohydrolase
LKTIIDPTGVVLADAGDSECEVVATLDMNVMEKYRAQIPCFNDRKPEYY